ncbi:alpha/beta hydrolase [Paenibacillus thermotolerans]|uniref:alpha/beta hydrolase n=1 Tax=Paenibacillus thermotolerans TaxID=3027807 RepID=UPI0023675EF8|nr:MULTISPECIES: alpha/beta fold hydrolase [unclassified Paenibacillus]
MKHASSTTPLPPLPLAPGSVETAVIASSTAIRAASVKVGKNRMAAIVSVFLAFIILSIIAVASLYAYIAWTLARPAVAPLTANPRAAAGLPYETVAFTNAAGDASAIEGWYIPAPAPSVKTIVFSHGYGGNREEIWVPIYELAWNANQRGFNVLMFDYGYAYHDDRVVTGGAQESYDLLGAVKYARTRGAEQVYVWGFSMGAGTALQSALQTSDIDAMILDSTFVLEPDTLYHNLKMYADLPKEPSLTLLKWLYPMMNGSGIDDVPYDRIKSADYELPIFFIHGTRDERSPYQIIEAIAGRQTNPHSQFWIVPGATHELVYRAGKDEYLTRTFAFLDEVGR